MKNNMKICNRQRDSLAGYDCRACLYYGGRRRRNIVCLADGCIYAREIEAARRRERSKNGSKN